MKTNNAKHTPGPWGCTDTSNHAHDYRLTKPDGLPLPVNAPCNDHSEQRANARLIAASPTMYEYIQKKASEGDKEAIDLIAKAEGREVAK